MKSLYEEELGRTLETGSCNLQGKERGGKSVELLGSVEIKLTSVGGQGATRQGNGAYKGRERTRRGKEGKVTFCGVKKMNGGLKVF